MTSSFSSILSSYLYVPLSGTPTTLVPHMLEQQYQREVEDKLSELKVAIQAVAGQMRRQCELINKKTIECQDKVDRSLSALRFFASQSMRFDDESDAHLFDSDEHVAQSEPAEEANLQSS